MPAQFLLLWQRWFFVSYQIPPLKLNFFVNPHIKILIIKVCFWDFYFGDEACFCFILTCQIIKSFDYENVPAERFLYCFFWAARKELFFQIKYRTTPISAWTFLNCGLAELCPKEDQTFVHMQNDANEKFS